NGLIIIDGKSDRGLLEKLWSYTCKYNRQSDFRLFSLGTLPESSQYNPLIGSPDEVIERVFSAFEFDNSYYKNIQFEVFSNLIRLFFDCKIELTFKRLYQSMTDKNFLRSLASRCEDDGLKMWAQDFLGLSPAEREQRISGLKASISHFAAGNTSVLFDSTQPTIDIDKALKENKIIYFQLPVLLSPFLGRATGKMILQNIQCAVANRHRSDNRKPKFFSIFLDDFTEYLYPGFVSILNKSRSANIGVVFAHQALGDIKALGDSIANSILTNSNLKIFMRGNDPDSAEYFSKVIGTKKTIKLTERRTQTLFQDKNTGDKSAREVDEFIVHPNVFKNELGTGEAIMIIPLSTGAKAASIKFKMFPNIKTDKQIIGQKNYPPKIETDTSAETKKSYKPLLENTEKICV
ncbi:TraM recognition domain-containing protein, partial [bacterium]|nr:TraM recognition domain-containing protein [bacterium]